MGLAYCKRARSDNTATNVVIDIADMDDVNAVLEGMGLKVIRIRRKM